MTPPPPPPPLDILDETNSGSGGEEGGEEGVGGDEREVGCVGRRMRMAGESGGKMTDAQVCVGGTVCVFVCLYLSLMRRGRDWHGRAECWQDDRCTSVSEGERAQMCVGENACASCVCACMCVCVYVYVRERASACDCVILIHTNTSYHCCSAVCCSLLHCVACCSAVCRRALQCVAH